MPCTTTRKPRLNEKALQASLQNERVLAKGRMARTRSALVVEGISAPEVRFIQPDEFGLLEIDPFYQRVNITGLINDIIHVLKAGGRVYDPVTLCKRDGEETMYIVDGQQRFWAHEACGLPLPAMIYHSTGRVAEALLYQAMNTRRALTANNMVKSHQGPGAELLRQVAQDEHHLLFNKVHFGEKGKRPYQAYQLIRGMLSVSRDVLPTGAVHDVCARLDHAISNDAMAATRCAAYLRMVPRTFPPAIPPKMLAVVALARVAERRWRGKKVTDHINLLPAQAVMERIRKLNWSQLILSVSMTHVSVVVEAIEKKWPEEAKRWI